MPRLLGQTSSHGSTIINCPYMVLYYREVSLHSRGVQALKHQAGPKGPWQHVWDGMRCHPSKFEPASSSVVPSCKGQAIQLHMPHTHAPPQNTHFTKTRPKPSKGHGRPPKHSWCHPPTILYICKKGPTSAPNGRGRLKSVPPAPCMDMWPCPNLACMTGEWHWLGVISLMVDRCPMKGTSNG